jgi:hypothetical protein
LAALFSEERFVVNEKFVLCRNISVKTRQLLLAAKRWWQFCKTDKNGENGS